LAELGDRRPPAALRYLKDLWSGNLPLARVFWTDMLVVGTLVNVVAMVVALLTFAAGIPVAVGVVIHFAPIPYNILLFMGVWQSASRDASTWSWPAQIVAALWFIAAFVV
jgi:hypothetical protein